MFNLYFVLSEELWTHEWYAGGYIKEPYRIAELIIAESHAQAKWLAWQNDYHSFTGNVRDMPPMNVRQRIKGVEGPPRIVSNESEYDNEDTWRFWGEPGEYFSVLDGEIAPRDA